MREIRWERKKDRNTDRIGGERERKIVAQTLVGGSRERETSWDREKDRNTDRSGGERKRETSWEREKEQKTDRSGRERKRVRERKIDAPTGVGRETWWFYLFLSHHIFLYPHSCLCFYLSLSPTLTLFHFIFNFEQLPN